MTEHEWTTGTDPLPMLWHLHGKADQRRLRLFAIACCRHIWPLLDDEALRCALELSERFTDGRLSKQELNAAAQAAHLAAIQTLERWYGPRAGETAELDPETVACWHPTVATAIAVAGATSTRRFGWVAAYAACVAERHERGEFQAGIASSHPTARGAREACVQATILRCLFGNPFRPVSMEPGWRTPAVRAIADAAYDGRVLPSGELDPTRLAVLSDALEEAGCADTAIVSHLRGPGPHVRGCWAVDLVRARE